MPYPTVYQSYFRIRTAPFFTMISLRKPSFPPSSSSLQFHLLRSRTINPKTAALKPSSFAAMNHHRRHGCWAASKGGGVELDWRERESQGLVLRQRNGSAFQYVQHQQNSRYGRYAYDDLSEEDSDDRQRDSSQQLGQAIEGPIFTFVQFEHEWVIEVTWWDGGTMTWSPRLRQNLRDELVEVFPFFQLLSKMVTKRDGYDAWGWEGKGSKASSELF